MTVREVDLSAARIPAAGLLLAGALLPVLGHPGITCPLRTITGIPGPLCGMSTSVQATVRFELDDALIANPAGVVVVAMALYALLVRASAPRRLRIPPRVVLFALTGMWLFQLFRFSVL